MNKRLISFDVALAGSEHGISRRPEAVRVPATAVFCCSAACLVGWLLWLFAGLEALARLQVRASLMFDGRHGREVCAKAFNLHEGCT